MLRMPCTTRFLRVPVLITRSKVSTKRVSLLSPGQKFSQNVSHCCDAEKCFHKTCLTAVTRTKVSTKRKSEKKLQKQKTARNTSKSRNATLATTFEDITKTSIQVTAKNIEFASASLSQNFHSRVCCMHLKSRKIDKFLEFLRVHCTCVSSSCTQGSSLPHGVQFMNIPHKIQYLGIFIASEHSCWQLLPSPLEC